MNGIWIIVKLLRIIRHVACKEQTGTPTHTHHSHFIFNQIQSRTRTLRMTEEFCLLKSYLDAGVELPTEKWVQLLTSGKDVIKARLSSWKVILNIEDSQAEGSERRAAATRYRKKVEEEIKEEVEKALEVLDNLDNRLAAAEDGDGKFKEFGLKMRDNLVKYLAMVTIRHDLRLEELDDSVLQHMFSFLDVDSLKAVRLVSRY